jgi:hypothetical protein
MVENDALLAAGLNLMRQHGKPLTKVTGFGRSMRYILPNGETVRVRTCNDHVLIVLSDKPKGAEAKLNIEGTDWLLIVMPEVERMPGKIRAYFLPARVAVEAARRTHHDWLATNPQTKGNNLTWCLWFRDDEKTNNFDKIWSKYRLNGVAETHSTPTPTPIVPDLNAGEPLSVKAEVEFARQRISRAAGVLPEAVRITIDFGGALSHP